MQRRYSDRDSPAPRIHPNLAEVYRRKVARLEEALNEPEARDEAAEALRALIDRIVLTPGEAPGEARAELLPPQPPTAALLTDLRLTSPSRNAFLCSALPDDCGP